MKRKVDYAGIRGFNYTQSGCWNDSDWWAHYDHDIVDRELGYAERLGLNSARIFLNYAFYHRGGEKFLADVKDFVQTAWKHGISTHPILFMGFRFLEEDLNAAWAPVSGLRPLSKTIQDKSSWVIGERYFDAVYEAIGQEEGLLFWDIANEPGYTDNFVTWYDEEPEYLRTFREKPDLEELKQKQEATWEIVRHFCKYVKQKDPDHDIGVGNIFIFETEASGTAELVDVIIFHDYSCTRGRLRGIYEHAMELSRKYGKPVLNNETACLARANPYDMALEMAHEYGVGWYLFELMIGDDGWNRVHGVVYPDGTVRDPSIVAAILGFFRKRDKGIIRADVNQEGHVDELLRRVNKFVKDSRNINMRKTMTAAVNGISAETEQMLELCEYAANLLEAGELVPMAYPPTARVAAFRSQENPDTEAIRDWLLELCNTLRQTCHLN